jgi:hypothetical protein
MPAATITAASKPKLKKSESPMKKLRHVDRPIAFLLLKNVRGGTRTPLRHFSLRFGTAFSGPPQ